MKSIKDAAEQFHVSAHTIRYYEKEGLISIPRDENGNRTFDEKSLNRLKAITFYRNLNLSVKQIKDLMDNFHNHEKSLEILHSHYQNLESKIHELEATKRFVVEKIELHELLLSLENQGKSREELEQAYHDFINNRT